MRFYNLLLHCYPASFRHEYAGEMRPIFARRRREARGLGVVGLWLSTMAEVVVNAAGAHVDILRQDVSSTARMLRLAPGFAITAVLIVALGIGATTAVFSVTDYVLVRPLPFPDPDRLVKIWESTPGYSRMELSPPNFRDWKAAATSYVSMGMYHGEKATMIVAGEPRQIRGARVSADVLPTLGRAPLMGRLFTAADDRPGAPGALILSHGFWQAEMGGDPGILGRALVLDNESYVIVGVMPPDVTFPESQTRFWMTLRFDEGAYADSQRSNKYLDTIGRLREGVTLAAARAETEAIAAQSRQRFPRENKDTSATVVALGDEVSTGARLLLVALLGASLCVLLIACANLANLLLARALARRRELAVRVALGAGRERLARQLLTESLLLAFAGGALGVAMAFAAVPLLAQLVPTRLPLAGGPGVDGRVLLFALGLTALTGLAFGLAPVLTGSGGASLDGLREGTRAGGGRRERLRSALVVAEIVASVVLLVSAGLLIRALSTVQRIDPGFSREGVLTARADLPMPAYRLVATREALYARLLQQVRAMPGVSAAGMVSFIPMSTFRGGIQTVSVKGDASAASDTRSANNTASLRYATPGFFAAMGMRLTRGRDIAETDGQKRQFVAVVSESFVRRYWPGQDPIGRQFTFAASEREVVGVVSDVRFRGLERDSEPQVYLPSAQVADGALTFYAPRSLAVRSSGDVAALAGAVREVIRRADPTAPIVELRTLGELMERETASRSVQVRVLAVFAAVAFVLAAVGIHGLLSFTVSQRTQEIGVRMALGASATDILALIARRMLLLAAMGVIPGVALAYIAGRSMQALLAGVPPADLTALASAVAFSTLMTILGSLVPTLRAVRVEPSTALRSE